jgi:hypothetical protein
VRRKFITFLVVNGLLFTAGNWVLWFGGEGGMIKGKRKI